MELVALLVGVGVVIWLVGRIQAEKPPPPSSTEQTRDLVEHARKALATVPIPGRLEFWDEALKRIDFSKGRPENEFPVLQVYFAARDAAQILYLMEGFEPTVEPPLIEDGLEGARYRDRLRARLEKTSEANIVLLRDAVAQSIEAFMTALPPFAFKDFDEVKADTRHKQSSGFLVPLLSTMPNPGAVIRDMMAPLSTPAVASAKLFHHVRLLYDRNVHEMSGVRHPPPPKAHPRLTLPQDHKGTSQEVIEGYLKHLPFKKLFETRVPFQIPPHYRFEHMWLVSPPGTGKSTTLSVLIDADLDLVKAGQASVIVMESNRDLIKSIEGLKCFAPGGDLHGKLVVIDVEDVEHPIAINLFDIGLQEINKASPRDREALLNSAVSLLEYVFRALLGAELTSRQSTLFNFTIQLLIQIPNATLDTFIDLMQPQGIYKYARYLDLLDPDAKQFFRLKFDSKEFEQTKAQVTDRIFAIKRIRALSRMFSARKTKLNLYDEMGKGRVILINAAKSLLQEDGVEVFGRFFLAMILLAAEKRQLLAKDERMPTFVYIDEAQDIIRRDEKLPVILDQARKFRVGMVLAHQRLDQMAAPVLNALYGSTATKFATQLSDANASALARTMGTTSEFIATQPHFHYAVAVRGYTRSAVSIAIPFLDFNSQARMTSDEADAVRTEMRKRYAIDRDEPPSEVPSEEIVAEPVEEVIAPEKPTDRRTRAKPQPRDVDVEVLSLTDKRKPDAPADW